ncbi:MAG TPA: hypothetical protein VLV88_16050 [Terriglobales bacterium]|nr:hypothetical protein [Terriglobales bacterium]
MANRTALGSAILIPVLIGSIGLMNIMHKQRFELFHTVDVLQLIASGMCYGVALAALLALLRRPRD